MLGKCTTTEPHHQPLIPDLFSVSGLPFPEEIPVSYSWNHLECNLLSVWVFFFFFFLVVLGFELRGHSTNPFA
jgi:hypothetical protein